jgi:hypothetical protein
VSAALRPTFGEIEARLAAEGFAPETADAAPEPAAEDELMPWFTRVLVGAGAWLSSLFLFGCLGVLFASSLEHTAIGLGPVLVVAGVLVLRAAPGSSSLGLFLRQGALAAALACTLAGQLLFVVGVSERAGGGGAAPALAALGVTVAVVVAAPEPIARFLSTCGAAAAFAWVLDAAGLSHTFDVVALALGAGAAALWLARPARLARRGEDTLSPVAYALAVAFLSTLLFATGVGPFEDFHWHDAAAPGRLSTIGLGLGAVAIAVAIRRELRLGAPTPPTAVAIAALALLGPATPGSPGLVGAVAVVLLALHRRAPVLLGLALAFLFFFLGAFYYAMTATLLVKAARLGVVGAALLGGAVAISRRARP